MSIKISEIIKELEKIAPLELQEEWDNSGWQVRGRDRDVRKILLCLDVTKDVVEEAVTEGFNLVISHHPMIFTPIKSLDADSVQGEKIIDLIKHNIDVYSAHTNFDEADGGNNDYVSQALNLQNIEKIYYNGSWQFGRTGTLKEPVKLKDFVSYMAERLDMPKEFIRFSGNPEKFINKVAICTGSGSDLIYKASDLDCQAVITGDVTHHKAIDALEMGLAVIDGTHFWTEINFTENLKYRLKEKFEDNIEILRSDVEKNPFLNII